MASYNPHFGKCFSFYLYYYFFLQALSGFVALRAMVRHTESRFHLSQFNGIQELRS